MGCVLLCEGGRKVRPAVSCRVRCMRGGPGFSFDGKPINGLWHCGVMLFAVHACQKVFWTW